MEKRRIEDIGAEELDQFISNYLLTKKPKKGGQHQPDTLTSIHRAILRWLFNVLVLRYGSWENLAFRYEVGVALLLLILKSDLIYMVLKRVLIMI